MINVTLALAVLLTAGFAMAKAGQRLRLPSVTGYICAGLILGPSLLNLIPEDVVGHRLDHFSQIALMLIAFGIGEHLEIVRLRRMAKSVGFIGLFETSGAFCIVGLGTYFVARATGVGEAGWGTTEFVTLSLLLGAISVATAPAATLHVMRELRAAGPLTATLMAVVAVDDGLAIMFFGVAVSAARHIIGTGTGTILGAIGASLVEILSSLLIGVITGLIIDFMVHRLRRRAEMLTAGLALLLMGGEVARLLHLSALLAGMAAGFTIVNRDRRDVRLFRAINDFEPPIYVLFFTLAGTHLKLSLLAVAGWVGVAYFLLRIIGKLAGSSLGARLAAAPKAVQRYLGLALVPQAGVAIGLIFLINSYGELRDFSSLITPVVLAAVVLSELTGPVCARFAVVHAGEVPTRGKQETVLAAGARTQDAPPDTEDVRFVPWTWGALPPPGVSQGVVIFGASHVSTVPGLARIATLMAYHHNATPMGVRVRPGQTDGIPEEFDRQTAALFDAARSEVQAMGYNLETLLVEAETVADGILSAPGDQMVHGIVIGHPRKGTSQEFQKVVEAVARKATCPIVLVKFTGVFHTERILVPVVSLSELRTVHHVLRSLASVGSHRITLLCTMPSDALEMDLRRMEEKMAEWYDMENVAASIYCRATPSEARLETIIREAEAHDLLVMAAAPPRGLQRIFFGSLAEDVAQHCKKPVLMVRSRKEAQLASL